MAEINVNLNDMSSALPELRTLSRSLGTLSMELELIVSSINTETSTGAALAEAIRKITEKMQNESNDVRELHTVLSRVISLYRTTEAEISGSKVDNISNASGGGDAGVIARIMEIIRNFLIALGLLPSGSGNTTSEYAGEPVDMCIGNYVNDIRELCLSGDIDLLFVRHYNARFPQKGVMGTGWSHNFECRLEVSDSELTLKRGDGRTERFIKNGDIYTSVYGSYDKITEDEECYTVFTRRGETYTYNREGQLISISDRSGYSVELVYEDGLLIGAKASENRFFIFFYNDEGLLSAVRDSMGRTLSFTYKNGLLTEAVSADGSSEHYEYSDALVLTAIINADGVRILENTFDSENRVIRQDFPDGTKMLYEYGEDSLRFTDRNGSVATYYHDERLRHIRTEFEYGSESYEYNDKNERVLYTDLNGSLWQREFDERGNVTALIDPLGYRTAYEYNDKNLRTKVITADGSVTETEYDENGNAVRITDATGAVQLMSYENGRITQIIDPDGGVTMLSYDDEGRITSISDDSGTEYHEFDNAGRLITLTDRRGADTHFEYDGRDRLTCVRDPLGRERRITYTAAGKKAVVKDFDGAAETFICNEMGLVEKYTDKSGNTVTIKYDNMSNPCEIFYPDGRVEKRVYNRANLLEKLIVDGEAERSFIYDPYGRLTHEFFADEEKHYSYDAIGRLMGTVNRDGGFISTQRDAMGRVTKRTAPDGSFMLFCYDAAGRCIRQESSLGRIISYDYTPAGRLKSRTDSEGVRTDYSYDKAGRISHVDYADGETLDFSYDAEGNLTGRRFTSGYTRYYEYDAVGRRISESDSDGRTKKIKYDDADNISEVISPGGARAFYEYSPMGKPVKVTDELGQITRFDYDAAGRMTAVLKGAYSDDEAQAIFGSPELYQTPDNMSCRLTTWERDSLGRVRAIRGATGACESFDYDIHGRLSDHKAPDGRLLHYSYLPGGSVSEITDGTRRLVSYGYNSMMHLCSAENLLGKSRYEFDSDGRLLSSEDSFGARVDYSLTPEGRVSTLGTDSASYDYSYDEFGRLASISMNGSTVKYTYDKNGRLSEKEMDCGIRESYEYTAAGQPASLTYHDADGIAATLTYKYDANGNLSEKRETRRDGSTITCRYEYDALNRLTARDSGGVRRTYRYDEFSNCIEINEPGKRVELSYDVLNRLLEKRVNGETMTKYAYDERGNMISEKGEGVSAEYTYDEFNRLSSVKTADGKVTEYMWDAMGNRIGKRSQGTEQHYTNDQRRTHHNVIAAKQGDCVRSFLWDFNLVCESSGSERRWFFGDELGSVSGAADSFGHITDEFRYEEFGAPAAGSSKTYPGFGFTGLQHDAETDSYFALSRMYAPRIGRFLEKDKERYIYAMQPESVNLYAYCRNNPLVFIDPEGTDCYIFYLPEWENEAISDRTALANRYGYSEDHVHMIPITNNNDLTNGWNGMGTVDGRSVEIDTVVIDTHANPQLLGFGDNSSDTFGARQIRALNEQNVGELVLYGCNAGHTDYSNTNPAAEFAQRVNGAQVLASDGTVYSDSNRTTEGPYESRGDDAFNRWAARRGHGGRSNNGWVEYTYTDGRINTRVIGSTTLLLTEMTDTLRRLRGTLCS